MRDGQDVRGRPALRRGEERKGESEEEDRYTRRGRSEKKVKRGNVRHGAPEGIEEGREERMAGREDKEA